MRLKVLLCLLVFVVNQASAALSNTDKTVGLIDIMGNDNLVIWVGDGVANQPASCSNYQAVSCDLKNEYCKAIMSVALLARTTDTKVEFNYSGQCNGGWAVVDRFRLMLN